MKKRALSIAMALTLSLGLSVPAMAAGEGPLPEEEALAKITLENNLSVNTRMEGLELPIHKYKLDLTLEKDLEMRPLTLRALRRRALFKVQEGIVRGFRDFLHGEGFTEIHTPKIVRAGAEGGANIFKLDYFGQQAYLAQSPQFYKQYTAGIFGRVFEIGNVYRAERHNTSRNLNEYIGLDFEMAYIDSMYDVM